MRTWLNTEVESTDSKIIGVDSPFFSTIALSRKKGRFPKVSGGFLERRIPGKNGNGRYRLNYSPSHSRMSEAERATVSGPRCPCSLLLSAHGEAEAVASCRFHVVMGQILTTRMWTAGILFLGSIYQGSILGTHFCGAVACCLVSACIILDTEPGNTASMVRKKKASGSDRIRKPDVHHSQGANFEENGRNLTQLFSGPNYVSNFFFGGCPTKMVFPKNGFPVFSQGH